MNLLESILNPLSTKGRSFYRCRRTFVFNIIFFPYLGQDKMRIQIELDRTLTILSLTFPTFLSLKSKFIAVIFQRLCRVIDNFHKITTEAAFHYPLPP